MLQDSPVSKQSWPLDHALFIRSAADTVRRLRNHACIALWCGGNEQTPAPDIDASRSRPCCPGGLSTTHFSLGLPAKALRIAVSTPAQAALWAVWTTRGHMCQARCGRGLARGMERSQMGPMAASSQQPSSTPPSTDGPSILR